MNRVRATEYMRRYALDAIIVTSPTNITYFTDYFCWLDPLFKEYMTVPGASSEIAQRYALIPLEGEPALIASPLMAVNAADSWVRDLRLFGDTGLDYSIKSAAPIEALPDNVRPLFDLLHQPPQSASPTDALVAVLSARGLADSRIGIEMEGLPLGAKADLITAMPRASFKDCTNLIRLIRAVKSQDEIARLTRGAEISEIAGMESLALARPGCQMADLIQHYRARIAQMGADFDHFAFGMRGMGIATEPNYALADDDVLYVDFGCLYQHYFSDTGTTLALRPPSTVLLARHAALRDCLSAATDVMRPGTKASAVQSAMWQTLHERGITVSNPHGHGLGVEIRDYPIIVADNGLRIRDDCVDVASDLPLEEDMVINLEAGIFMPGVASLHIEQTCVVTRDGNRPLVSQHRAGPFIPDVSH
ncbi:MAG: M24 family metallopeptidase [Aggregatilineales bacterium]